MSFGGTPTPYKPPSTPLAANSSVREAGNRMASNMIGYKSFIATSSSGLKRKDKEAKTSVIGGS
jgi:hypothetical protein